MTLYTFPDPLADVRATLTANAALLPAGTTSSTSYPSSSITVPHIQYAWDGTPSQDRRRELATVRVTVWGKKTNGIDRNGTILLASLAQAILLDSGSASVWRYTAGTGRSYGIDPDSGLPFCTFTLTAETRPSPVA